MRKTNNTFYIKSKYYEKINKLKQLKLINKIEVELMKHYNVRTVLGNEKLSTHITTEGNCVKY